MNIWQHPNMQRDAIERSSGIGYREFYQSYTKASRPIIMTDAIKNWPAIEKWSLDYFRSHAGQQTVRGEDGSEQSLAQCIDLMLASTKDNPGPYIPSLRFHENWPELYNDILPTPNYWGPNWLYSPWLMPGLSSHPLRRIAGIEINLSGPNSTFPEGIHYDDLMTQTFVAQVHGTKELILFSPEQTKLIYAKILNKRVDTFSQSEIPVDTDFDIADFPLTSELMPIQAILQPGEMLCTPPGWWHCVRALEPSIAVVTSVANQIIWPRVRRAVIDSSRIRHQRWNAPIATAVYAIYMTVFGWIRSASDRIRYREMH